MPRRATLLLLLAACAPPPAATSPPASAPSSATSSSSARPADADDELEARVRAIVVAEKARLRACYETSLARDANVAGKVVMVVDVDQGGRAGHVYEARREGSFTDADVACFAGVLRAAKYHDGAARPVRIQVPLAFAAQTPSP